MSERRRAADAETTMRIALANAIRRADDDGDIGREFALLRVARRVREEREMAGVECGSVVV